jgi:hypothetical protein
VKADGASTSSLDEQRTWRSASLNSVYGVRRLEPLSHRPRRRQAFKFLFSGATGSSTGFPARVPSPDTRNTRCKPRLSECARSARQVAADKRAACLRTSVDARASFLTSWALPLTDVRTVRSVLVTARIAPEHIDQLVEVSSRKASRPDNDLVVPFSITRQSCALAALRDETVLHAEVLPALLRGFSVMERAGLEPATSGLQSRGYDDKLCVRPAWRP